MNETPSQHEKQLVEEEIRDLSSYLDNIPPSLRSSGAFTADEARLERLKQELSRLQTPDQLQAKSSGNSARKRRPIVFFTKYLKAIGGFVGTIVSDRYRHS